jgi:hypothetical protein
MKKSVPPHDLRKEGGMAHGFPQYTMLVPGPSSEPKEENGAYVLVCHPEVLGYHPFLQYNTDDSMLVF